jgi:hypothetical protein
MKIPQYTTVFLNRLLYFVHGNLSLHVHKVFLCNLCASCCHCSVAAHCSFSLGPIEPMCVVMSFCGGKTRIDLSLVEFQTIYTLEISLYLFEITGINIMEASIHSDYACSIQLLLNLYGSMVTLMTTKIIYL